MLTYALTLHDILALLSSDGTCGNPWPSLPIPFHGARLVDFQIILGTTTCGHTEYLHPLLCSCNIYGNYLWASSSGAGLAEELARHGASVVLSGRRENMLQAAVDNLHKQGLRASYVRVRPTALRDPHPLPLRRAHDVGCKAQLLQTVQTENYTL